MTPLQLAQVLWLIVELIVITAMAGFILVMLGAICKGAYDDSVRAYNYIWCRVADYKARKTDAKL